MRTQEISIARAIFIGNYVNTALVALIVYAEIDTIKTRYVWFVYIYAGMYRFNWKPWRHTKFVALIVYAEETQLGAWTMTNMTK